MNRRSIFKPSTPLGARAARPSVASSAASSVQQFRPGRPTTFGSGILGRPSGVGQSGAKSTGHRLSTHVAIANRPPRAHDPRKISDRNYQAKMISDLLEFLRSCGYPHSITEKVLRQPTRQDFVGVFSFIYSYLDEGYKYDGKISLDIEIPKIFKSLGYPFTINKSTIQTFNAPHAWPSVLAALHWLKELVEYCMSFEFEKYVFPSGNQDEFDEERDVVGLSIYQYYVQCYVSRKAGDNKLDELDMDLEQVLVKNSGSEARLNNLNKENERLLEELRLLENSQADEDAMKNEIGDIKLDIAKIDDYMSRMNSFFVEKEREIGGLKANRKIITEQLDQFKTEIERKQDVIAHQDIKPADVHRYVVKKQEIQKRINAYDEDRKQLTEQIWKREKAIAVEKDRVDTAAHSVSTKLGRLPSLLPNTKDTLTDIEIRPFSANFLDDFKKTIWPLLESVKMKCHGELEVQEAELMEQRDSAALVESNNRELQFQLNALEAKIQDCDKAIQKCQQEGNDEYLRKCEELEGLQRSKANAERDRTMSSAEKEALLAQLTSEYNELLKEYNEAVDIMENVVPRSEQNLRDHQKFVEDKQQEMLAKLQQMLFPDGTYDDSDLA